MSAPTAALVADWLPRAATMDVDETVEALMEHDGVSLSMQRRAGPIRFAMVAALLVSLEARATAAEARIAAVLAACDEQEQRAAARAAARRADHEVAMAEWNAKPDSERDIDDMPLPWMETTALLALRIPWLRAALADPQGSGNTEAGR